MTQQTLPAGFEPMVSFVPEWALPDSSARMHKRQATPIEEIKAFYAAMLPLGEQALMHLREFELGALPPGSDNLLKLMLSLAEVAPAVEWYDSPQVTDGFPVTRIRYLRQIPDTAAQS